MMHRQAKVMITTSLSKPNIIINKWLHYGNSPMFPRSAFLFSYRYIICISAIFIVFYILIKPILHLSFYFISFLMWERMLLNEKKDIGFRKKGVETRWILPIMYTSPAFDIIEHLHTCIPRLTTLLISNHLQPGFEVWRVVLPPWSRDQILVIQ